MTNTTSHPNKPQNPNRLVTMADLQEFKQDLLQRFYAIIHPKASEPKKWLKTYEVKKMLALSSGTLQTLRNNGTIAFTKIGGTLYYDAADITKLLEGTKSGNSRKRL
ncbi:helix-turn-helix domain-containing protein [Paraflavitalea sp. CAU 1676]|uniref:helix-turn-helix domain-containing protein n=1 Tax=Paraflavitalea sp. CAU 1676 TaxID=3032598 RepID=UPI0023D9C498|nr:helix-turn-helix domain-containing protein [Paraflavitalea sp. CAU 1676]MDF2191355.1 helix-turn-helix domain-containing protein [Paraflavitalea sp. CAU 1676]